MAHHVGVKINCCRQNNNRAHHHGKEPIYAKKLWAQGRRSNSRISPNLLQMSPNWVSQEFGPWTHHLKVGLRFHFNKVFSLLCTQKNKCQTGPHQNMGGFTMEIRIVLTIFWGLGFTIVTTTTCHKISFRNALQKCEPNLVCP